MKTLFLLAVVVLTGCTGAKQLARELSKDNATVVVNIGTVYGTAKIVRTNPGPGHSATISPDGSVTISAVAPAFAPSSLPALAPQRPLSSVLLLPAAPGGNLAPASTVPALPFQSANAPP